MKKYTILFLEISMIIFWLLIIGIYIWLLPYFAKEFMDHYPNLIIYIALVFIYGAGLSFSMALFHSFMLVHHLYKDVITEKSNLIRLSSIQFFMMIASVLMFFSLPFFYIMAQLDDAPGIFAVVLFFFSLSLVILATFKLLEYVISDIQHIKEVHDES